MSDFVPRALEECPGWVECLPGRMAHYLSFGAGDVDVSTQMAPAIAAAQRLEWKAKRLAELEAEREHAAKYRPTIGDILPFRTDGTGPNETPYRTFWPAMAPIHTGDAPPILPITKAEGPQ